jgi:nucleoside 2-deoxyribosyltransferase
MIGQLNIAPIETVYRGYRFRSRLEARWAVFFDAAEIEWQYEPEGYQLKTGYYLPDFWLPRLEAFVEVKPTYEAYLKATPDIMKELVERSGHRGMFLIGSPTTDTDHLATMFEVIMRGDRPVALPSWWDHCLVCNEIYFGDRCDCCVSPAQGGFQRNASGSSRLYHALSEAQRARFEHGESGKPRPYSKTLPEVDVYVAGSVIEDVKGGVCIELDDETGFEVTVPVVVRWRKDIFGEGDNFNADDGPCDGRFHYAGPTIWEDHGQANESLAGDCIKEVKESDVMFVWIDRPDTRGTLVEIGAAHAFGRPIFIAFADVALAENFYFAGQLASVAITAPNAVAAWRYFKNWQNQ